MKHTKRVLSILLALLLGLTALTPAIMASEPADPYAPILNKRPRVTVKKDTITLSADAQLPEGVTGELTYDWYLYESMLSSKYVAAGASITVEAARRPIHNYWDFGEVLSHLLVYPTYYVQVTNVYEDADGTRKHSTATSEGVQIILPQSLFGTIAEYFKFGSEEWDFGKEGETDKAAGIFFVTMAMPVLFPAYLWSRVQFAIISVLSLFRK